MVSAQPNPVVILVKQNEVDQIINELKNLEDELLRNDIVLKKNTKEFSHQNFFGGNNREVLKEMNDAQHALSYFINYLKQFVCSLFTGDIRSLIIIFFNIEKIYHQPI